MLLDCQGCSGKVVDVAGGDGSAIDDLNDTGLLQGGYGQGVVAGEFFVYEREPGGSTIDQSTGLDSCFTELDSDGARDNEVLTIQVILIKFSGRQRLSGYLQGRQLGRGR